MLSSRINPVALRLEASTRCQLRCPACPTRGGTAGSVLGQGVLRAADFQRLLQANPRIREVELSSYGEIFLNPELLQILAYAHEHGVVLRADNGVNLNRVSDEVLEGLVKFGFHSMTCSIDGASQETYGRYRVNGDFATVIRNIQKLNSYKQLYASARPLLAWQFIVFGHNEHEIALARGLAEALHMSFHLKLSWDPELGGSTRQELLRGEMGAASRQEYRERFGVDYADECCYGMWYRPQINWDGRVLGCSRNFWSDYGSNAFTDGLVAGINNPRVRYARKMLLGKAEARPDIPCTTCDIYEFRRETGGWVQPKEIRVKRGRLRRSLWSRRFGAFPLYRVARASYRLLRSIRNRRPRLRSQVCPLDVPLPTHQLQSWIPYAVFGGSTERLPALSCHVSALAKGTIAHAPHTHADEEALIVLAGSLDLIAPDASAPDGLRRTRLDPGQILYYPFRFAHTVQATDDGLANYLIFKWSGSWKRARSALPHGVFSGLDPTLTEAVKEGFSSRMLFAGRTNLLRRLSCHTSTLTPGAGYEPHADPYDVAIVVLEGEVETLGRQVGRHGVIFYAQGEPHGMRNSGSTPARYLVFEFHGRRRLGLRRPLLPRPLHRLRRWLRS